MFTRYLEPFMRDVTSQQPLTHSHDSFRPTVNTEKTFPFSKNVDLFTYSLCTRLAPKVNFIFTVSS